MKLFKSPVFVGALAVFCLTVFATIVFLQVKQPPTDNPPSKPSPITSATQTATSTELEKLDMKPVAPKEAEESAAPAISNPVSEDKKPQEVVVTPEKTVKAVEKTSSQEDEVLNMDDKRFTTLLAKFKTVHDENHCGDAARNVNLALASKKIDGYIVNPGAKFSFNKVVGERSKKNGFKEAGCISAGRVVPGLGGGICQVSTTLYRAVLLCGAKIDERYNHSIYEGIAYAQRGLDAAVSWGTKDFRFTNKLNMPLMIKSTSGEGWVEVSIYGEKLPFKNVELYTKNEVKYPAELKKRVNKKLKDGEVKIVHPGVDGYSVESYRVITKEDGSTSEERLSKDKYLTFNRIEERNR